METVTIPRKITGKDDLVVVRKKEYEKLFRFWAGAEQISKREKVDINKGFRQIEKGKFFTSKQVRHELGL